MNALSAVQDAMQVWLLQGDAGIVAFVDDDLAAHRLRIYADAYVLRLLDVLGRTLEPVYGFRSLLAFKSKFQPSHRKKYYANALPVKKAAPFANVLKRRINDNWIGKENPMVV